MLPPIVASGLFSLGANLIDRIFPDKTKADEAKLKLLELEQTGQLKLLEADTSLALKQGDINLEEAKSENIFKSGWRPAVGWTCAAAFFAKFLGGPFIFVVGQFTGHYIELPPIDLTEMLPVLVAMLGLGAYRTFEKTKK